jgi:hypothetical protein
LQLLVKIQTLMRMKISRGITERFRAARIRRDQERCEDAAKAIQSYVRSARVRQLMQAILQQV